MSVHFRKGVCLFFDISLLLSYIQILRKNHHDPYQKTMTINLIYRKILLLIILLTATLTAGSNLPQVPAASIITGKDHRSLKTYFGNYNYLPSPLNDSIGMLLLKHLPKQYKNGCKEMISGWGKEAKGTSATAVKPIHLVKHTENIQHVLLVYTCYSSAREYEDRYYDERLAVLRIDSSNSSITVIPHSKECDKCSELSHIGLLEDTLKIDNTDAVSIIIGTSNDNPCCGGSTRIEEVSIKYFTINQQEVKEKLSLITSRKEIFHDDQNGDSIAIHTRNVETVRDANGNIVSVILHGEITINGSVIKREMNKYSWNRKRKAFEEVWN